jgi:hypothetical protein
MTAAAREVAWSTVHDVIARMPGWAVGPCAYHGDDALWHVAAVGADRGSRD